MFVDFVDCVSCLFSTSSNVVLSFVYHVEFYKLTL